nr:MAG: ORF1 [TTV-like mini virus]
MPFYYRRRQYYPRRHRWSRRGWTRGTFRRRWRKRRWVRKQFKHKLSKITVKTFQPPCIRSCKIKGKTCLIYYNNERIGNNSVMYEDSYAPEHWPGGGGFAVMKFTLENLYDMFEKCRNWWTTSNTDLPLCRYLGCKLILYQCEELDYIVKIQRELPPNSNKLTYPSCQPSVMLMSKGKITVPSKKNQRRRKPYKSIFIKPPPQLHTDWYFQVDIVKTALFVIHATTCNLQDYFIKKNQLSNTITFRCLNTQLIQNRKFQTKTKDSWFYKEIGTIKYYFYRYDGNKSPNESHNFELGYIVPLAQTNTAYVGHSFSDRSNWETIIPSTFLAYAQQMTNYYGNPFNPHNLEHSEQIYTSQLSPETFKNTIATQNKQATDTWQSLESNRQYALTQLTDPIFFSLQYNPNKDTGHGNKCYLLSNTSGHGWDEPLDEDLILDGFPIYILLFGYLDFQKKLKKALNIDTDYILCFKTQYTFKPYNLPIVIINSEFEKGHSPYEQTILPPDTQKWYPQVQYQLQELNKILKVGPGTPQTEQASENVQMYYKFYWKWGGNPPKSVNVNNPSLQEQYPIPRNQFETNSLQNPAQAPETVLYSFDQRHGALTKTALQRIADDWSTKSLISSITDPTTKHQLKDIMEQLQESENKEAQTQTEIQQQLYQLKQQQHTLRKQIISLMNQL